MTDSVLKIASIRGVKQKTNQDKFRAIIDPAYFKELQEKYKDDNSILSIIFDSIKAFFSIFGF